MKGEVTELMFSTQAVWVDGAPVVPVLSHVPTGYHGIEISGEYHAITSLTLSGANLTFTITRLSQSCEYLPTSC